MWRRSPFDDLFNVFRDFENVFGRTFPEIFRGPFEGSKLLPSGKEAGTALAGPNDWPGREPGAYTLFPAVESFEKDGKLHIRAEMPGVEPSDVNVSITGNRLTIGGERKSSREMEKANVFVRELSHGTFERSFTLPEGVDADAVKADFSNGMLSLTLPLPVQGKSRQVKIQIGQGGDKKKAA